MPSKEAPGEFIKVDQTTDPAYFIEFLDARRTMEGEREIKEMVLHLLNLRLGAHVLDVGCGTGGDAREIAGLVGTSGRVVGVDASETMIAEARRRAAGCTLALEFRVGDVRKLDFPDSSFDAVRTDRVLTFVPEIEQALGEIFRALRPGGRLVTSELDSEILFIDSPMADTSRDVLAAYAQTFAQPRLGRQLLRLVNQAGFTNVKSVPRFVCPPYRMFRRLFDGFLRSSVENGKLAEGDVTPWLEALAQADADEVFNLGITVFTVCGQKP